LININVILLHPFPITLSQIFRLITVANQLVFHVIRLHKNIPVISTQTKVSVIFPEKFKSNLTKYGFKNVQFILTLSYFESHQLEIFHQEPTAPRSVFSLKFQEILLLVLKIQLGLVKHSYFDSPDK